LHFATSSKEISICLGKSRAVPSPHLNISNGKTDTTLRGVSTQYQAISSGICIQLTDEEYQNLKSQFATSSWGSRRKLPYAFTEHGAVMAASVLNTESAVQASIYVVKAFVQMRNVIGMYKELEQRLTDLEAQFGEQGAQIQQILQVIRHFVQKENEPRKPIGFK
jgi:hypothetical protein